MVEDELELEREPGREANVWSRPLLTRLEAGTCTAISISQKGPFWTIKYGMLDRKR